MERFQWETRPVALPANCVIADNCRITVLTPKLLRLEYAPKAQFEDRASQMAFYRDFPACEYTYTVEEGILCLQTEALELRYRVGHPFTEDSLSIRLKNEPGARWSFGEDFEDLGGTTRTLDRVDGRFPVERGVCSRNGFSVLDDSNSLLIEGNCEIGIRNEGSVDCYFFGYGFSYLDAVKDLYRLTGRPPLLPAYALGNWWSRYYAYTQQEYLDLMDKFRQQDIPFSVGVVDMDWHVTKIPEELKMDTSPRLTNGWTGYSWNKELFPDYRKFLKELHKRNLKTALNLHPAVGVCCHEDMYPEMAKACGIDPATKQRVPLNILSAEFMEKYFDILHHPYENDGVDFWWMDWQQGTNYWWIHEKNQPGEYADPRERMDPLWMLNHLHILDISRDGSKRPMFFSRYSGPGSHRYPVGFSGDTVVSWDSLKFQPEFTAMASNAGYSWWSHDIGGHCFGACDNELYIRWIQLGVFSPINRLHSTNDMFMFKEPFMYTEPTRSIACRWLRLRHSLFPYLYTMNYRNHTELVPLVQPMYYSHPKCGAAYEVPTQFWFGSELIAAPITDKNDPESGLGHTKAWLPKGYWFDFFTGMHYASRKGRKLEVYRPLDDMPVFAKAGAIVPMANYREGENTLSNAEDMSVLLFPGADNTFTLCEDAGDGDAYLHGEIARTTMELQWNDKPEFVIHAAKGDISLLPEKRTWRIGLRGFHRDLSIAVSVDGNPVNADISWDPEINTHWVVVTADVTACVSVSMAGEQLIWDNRDVLDRCRFIVSNAQIPFKEKNRMWEQVIRDVTPWTRRLNLISIIQHHGVTKALNELFSLTDDPYTGSEIPE